MRVKCPHKNQISLQKAISEGMWPSKVVVFALVAKRDFATMPLQIDNLRGQFTAVTKQIRLYKYITKLQEKSTTYF